MLPEEAKERLANRRSIASGDTDDFTVGQAIDLIHNEVNKFYSAQGEMPPYMEGM
jgi:predicted DNA-binding protein